MKPTKEKLQFECEECEDNLAVIEWFACDEDESTYYTMLCEACNEREQTKLIRYGYEDRGNPNKRGLVTVWK